MGHLEMDLLRQGAAYVEQWVGYRRERRDLPGVVVAIWGGDSLVLSRGFGYADVERQIPMTPQHIFRVASHSKTFTATAVMQLVEQEKLRLDDRLSAYIPWLGVYDRLAPLTIRQALHHASGMIRDGEDAGYWQLDGAFPDQEGLRRLVEDGGAAVGANETFKYSNLAFALLGLVIEAASGLPYNSYVARHIVDRLGLADTGPETGADVQGRLARGYTVRRLGLPRRPIPDVATAALSPATGFYATAEDMCRYAAAHFIGDERLLSDASKREMQHPAWTVEQADEQYGLGFSVATIGERRMVGHGGGFPGHATRTLIDPRDRLVVVVFVNEVGGPAASLARTSAAIVDFALRQPHGAAGHDAAALARYTGRFVNLWGVCDVAAFGDTLLALNPEEDDPIKAATRLEIQDSETLRITRTNGYGAPGETLRYIRDDAGRVERVILGGMSYYPPALYRAREERRR